MAYCAKCGEKLDDDAKFCPSCGNPCNAGYVNVNESAAESAAVSVTQNVSTGKKKFLIAGSVVLCVIALIAGIVIYNTPKESADVSVARLCKIYLYADEASLKELENKKVEIDSFKEYFKKTEDEEKTELQSMGLSYDQASSITHFN